jgi:hypothetical protein
VIVVAATVLLWSICPPTVLYCPLKPTPVVLWIVMVTERAVRLAVLSSRITCSLNQGLLVVTAGVTVTPPVPVLAFTVRLRVIARVIPPPVPLTVMFTVPVVAALEAARVKLLLVPVAEAGLKVAVTPLGNPLALRVTALVNPPARLMVIVLAPLAPRFTVRLDGLAESVKSGGGGALTVRLNVVDRVRPPPEPLIVTLAIPVAALLDAAINIDMTETGPGGDSNEAVTPLGNPLALNATTLLNPPVRAIVTVAPLLAPRLMVRLDGFTDSVKSGGGGALTVRLKVVDRLSPPPEPLIVTLTVPVAAVLEAASVSALLPPVVEGGLNVAVTPLGNPVALKVTLLVNPPLRVMVIVLAPLAPRLMVRLGGLADSVKFGLPPGPCHVRKTVSAGLDRGL